MSWYIKQVGTRKGVKDEINKQRSNLEQGGAPVEFMLNSIDRLEHDGVIIEGSGHAGSVNSLKIEPITLAKESEADKPVEVPVEAAPVEAAPMSPAPVEGTGESAAG